MSDLPQADRIAGLPHPCETEHLFGHDGACAQVLDAFNGDRMHHAWMLTGPKGIGKASLAYHISRFLLAAEPAGDSLFGTPPPATSLSVPADHPVARRIKAGSEPGLCILRRPVDDKTGKLKTVIPVDTVRELRRFFGLSAGGNGRRVVIVDCIDEMNANAANALLKVLEEPPQDAVLLLVTHQPSRILPTIRSRCRTLACAPMSPDDLERAFAQALPDQAFDPGLNALAAGSVGRAAELSLTGGTDMYRAIVSLCQGLPQMDRGVLLKLANSSGRAADGKLEQLLDLLDLFLARLARAGVSAPGHEAASGEVEVFARLCPGQAAARIWADAQLELSQRARQGKTANLDPSSLILDMGLKIEETASKILREKGLL
ncbi:MAG: DNA polymerase III subunit delta' [Planktomarina sp.]|nr:DNA polymerase III subunit delta' [Planktomarina sp.]